MDIKERAKKFLEIESPSKTSILDDLYEAYCIINELLNEIDKKDEIIYSMAEEILQKRSWHSKRN